MFPTPGIVVGDNLPVNHLACPAAVLRDVTRPHGRTMHLRNHIRLGLAGVQCLGLIHQMNRLGVAMYAALAPLPHRGTDASANAGSAASMRSY